MLRLILRRFISLPFVILSVTFLTFIVSYLAPGDPILALMGNQRDPEIYARLRTLYGLDLPWYQQYGEYLGGLLQGDLGLSFRFAQRPVIELIQGGLPVSFGLGLTALSLSVLIGIPLGLVAALYHNTPAERLIMALILALYAIPSFVLIPILQWINYQVYLATGWSLPAAGWGRPEHWVMPVVVLSAASLGYIARVTRSSVREVLEQDFIRTARAKGLPERRVRWTHMFRNAALPILTVIGPAIAFLVTGAFVVESLFSIPGIGFLSVQAIQQRDYPVIQGTTVILALSVVLMNLVTDLLYSVVDPRVRLEG
ncbi:MAG: ABC transporter permease [Pleurocapsa minor GSE-CHR-MK-17-07R]|jgi:ABC-type dipeptide/oligopeptide/nickel transport system permease component|nr:ABC transporter permease [Pleurocapsa minor GSE-CHR-MK 17-07R]